MNCESAQELLSSLYDRELSADLDEEMRAHVERCPECVRKVAEFAQLSKLTAELREPAVPTGTWPGIESALDNKGRTRGGIFDTPRLRHRSRLAIAATLLVGASVALGSYWIWRSSEPHAVMAATFDAYLKEFHEYPEQAQQVLISRYDGRPLDLSHAAGDAEFPPNAPEELPEGFKRQEVYVLKMPCCTCTQTVYKNKSGSVMALFEHSEKQPEWFGNRPRIEANCHGKATNLVQLPHQLAATWKCGRRYLTVIGAQNVEQVADLVAFLDART
jgi:putative zinc finger protein